MNKKLKRITTAQAIIQFLKNQYVERDGVQNKFFAGCFGIFGHGNLAGIGQALQQNPDFRYYQTRNEQAMVHTAAAYAKTRNRLSTFACTSSIGPGATNMITAAAAATINRIPVLLLPGDIFATRVAAPVLQQLETEYSQDISVNDCFKPVSKYWDRINRPEQIITSLLQAMAVLTSQAETGTVTLALPQDVQAEAFDFPEELFKKRIWFISRPRADLDLIKKAIGIIKESKRPLIIAGGGVTYSGANKALLKFVQQTGIPVAETFAGKGSLPYDTPELLGSIGATGTYGSNIISKEADLIIGIGTRYSDFTTASNSAFQNPYVKFININIAEFDAQKKSATALTGDAKVILEELTQQLQGYSVDSNYKNIIHDLSKKWDNKITDFTKPKQNLPVTQAEVIGVINNFINSEDILVCAAGSLPGDLHKLWRTKNPKGFHLEYGYSTMGYEIAGGLGVKMASPEREVYVMVGDGSYLMMSSDIITSIQEGYKLIIILLNNNGFGSIGALSESLGSKRFGTLYKYRDSSTGQLDGDNLPVDFCLNAKSLGANVFHANDLDSLKNALAEARAASKTSVIITETDLYNGIEGYAWWDVPVAETSEMESVNKAYQVYKKNKENQKHFL